MPLKRNRKATRLLFFLCLMLCSLTISLWAAQQAEQPSADKITTARARAEAQREQWRQTRTPMLMNDFGELARYRDANAQLKAASPQQDRVVFMGDSITDGWPLADYFPGKGYVDRGISGQTTAQMLVRFREDVIALQPRVVVILAGTNDIAGNTGPITLDEIEANYASMAELARAHNIRVIFSSVLPVNDYTPESQNYFPLRSPDQILELNRWLKEYCAAQHFGYVDYFSAMTDEKGLLKRNLAEDGLHPNPAGYKIMAPLAAAAIEAALSNVPGK
ncbi:MAG: SGNH/GDSL hydrolase family protein [Acidobacteriota bacterium]|nr:SGNH/GDSL hydrolase family protein [Acidobacteriota bacterium]